MLPDEVLALAVFCSAVSISITEALKRFFSVKGFAAFCWSVVSSGLVSLLFVTGGVRFFFCCWLLTVLLSNGLFKALKLNRLI